MSNKVHVRDNSIVHKNSVYSTQLNIYNFYMVASFEGYLLSIGHCLEGFYFPPFSTFTSSSLPFTISLLDFWKQNDLVFMATQKVISTISAYKVLINVYC